MANKRGRQKGERYQTTVLLKHAILKAAENVGGHYKPNVPGLIAYLEKRAEDQPVAFMGLLAKVLPLTVDAEIKSEIKQITEIVYTPKDREIIDVEHRELIGSDE